jgi:hypothetical protein
MSSSAGSSVFYAIFLPLIGLVGVGLGSDRKRRKEHLTAAALVILLFAGLVFQIACGGSSSTSQTKPGTPTGTYTITVTGADSTGALVHNTPTTLKVQ